MSDDEDYPRLNLPGDATLANPAQLSELRDWLHRLKPFDMSKLIDGYCSRCDSWNCSGWCDYETPM